MITVVNIQADVKTPFRVTQNKFHLWISIPLGVLEHRFFHTEIKCLRCASWRFCIEVTVHVVVGLE